MSSSAMITSMEANKTAARVLFNTPTTSTRNWNRDDETVATIRSLAIRLICNITLDEDAIDH